MNPSLQNTNRPYCLTLDRVSKKFGSVSAVQLLSLSIPCGGIYGLLGPSGSGKTTVLRLLAGLTQPDSGRIMMTGEDITEVPPAARDINTVFQEYSLFPHLDVQSNIAFGLKIKRMAKIEVNKRTSEALSLVRLTGLESKKPHQLSGGERQRVALARALVNRPSVLLLDEPFAALDEDLKNSLHSDIREIQRQSKITLIYVTHNQKDALSLADNIAIIRKGRLEQAGSTQEVFHWPSNPFVADFLGYRNSLSGTLVGEGSNSTVNIKCGNRVLEGKWGGAEGPEAGMTASLFVRPGNVSARPPKAGRANSIEGRVLQVTFQGDDYLIYFELPSGEKWRVLVPANIENIQPTEGEEVALTWSANDSIAFHSETGTV